VCDFASKTLEQTLDPQEKIIMNYHLTPTETSAKGKSGLDIVKRHVGRLACKLQGFGC
jgi:hypothetical protein